MIVQYARLNAMGPAKTHRSHPKLVPGAVADNVVRIMNAPKVATSSANRQCQMSQKRLIVTGDDFGLNSKVNEAIERYHQAGLLTQASLMVNEAGVDEALRIAKRNPRLTVGLHLTLCCGHAARLSLLTDGQRQFEPSPARAGLRYAFSSRLASDLAREIVDQFGRFSSLGCAPVYWDGHTHLHLHPTVLNFTLPVAKSHHFHAVRLVREPGGGLFQVIFGLLSRAAKGSLARNGVRFVDQVHGLRHTGQMTTSRFESCVRALNAGWSEIYFHPGAEPEELDPRALTELIQSEGIQLSSARELSGSE